MASPGAATEERRGARGRPHLPKRSLRDCTAGRVAAQELQGRLSRNFRLLPHLPIATHALRSPCTAPSLKFRGQCEAQTCDTKQSRCQQLNVENAAEPTNLELSGLRPRNLC